MGECSLGLLLIDLRRSCCVIERVWMRMWVFGKRAVVLAVVAVHTGKVLGRIARTAGENTKLIN